MRCLALHSSKKIMKFYFQGKKLLWCTNLLYQQQSHVYITPPLFFLGYLCKNSPESFYTWWQCQHHHALFDCRDCQQRPRPYYFPAFPKTVQMSSSLSMLPDWTGIFLQASNLKFRHYWMLRAAACYFLVCIGAFYAVRRLDDILCGRETGVIHSYLELSTLYIFMSLSYPPSSFYCNAVTFRWKSTKWRIIDYENRMNHV